MEEAKAAAYYDELTRKGEGAARFKQGLGFSSSSSADAPDRFASKTSSSAPLLSTFVRASSPGAAAEIQKQARLASIHDKLNKSRRRSPSPSPGRRRRSGSRERGGGVECDRRRRRRSRSGSGDRCSRGSRRRSPSVERSGGFEDDRRRSRRRRRRSDSEDEGGGGGNRHSRGSRRRSLSGERSDAPRRRSRRSRSDSGDRRSRSPYSRSRDRRKGMRSPENERSKSKKGGVEDYSLLIEGYSQMTPAEKVKARMKLQLSQTAAKDIAKGVNTGWERFDFNKDAPLDDEEIEAAEDDASVVKSFGQSFRFSAIEATREAEVKAAHDQAMFGAPIALPSLPEAGSLRDNEPEEESERKEPGNDLISDKVIALQQGSWRDRARKLQNGSKS